ncbi:uncharacterized protein LOC108196655 isoform X2 [Daucus carota subsp. sativus]|uniref:uncharacterized protein LOC108196655 isoform X2 n=1 Tax=Daucus carota subsp. sativus TaxID=79200 RepID=UPI0007F012E8|nr:PREDICTED: uncharacterized protein LOC108196655 isoform X2 [Daucus carota subsp. sativus]
MLIKPAWGINLRLVLEGLVNCNKQDTRLVRVAIEEIAGMPGLDLNKFAPRNEAKFIQNITEVVAENARSLRHKLAKATKESASCFPQIQNGNEVESVQEIEEKVTEVKLMHNKWSIYLFIFGYNFSVESARFYCLAWRIDFFLGGTNLNIMKRLISWTSVLFFIFPAYNGTGGFDEELLRFWDELVKIRECNGTSGLAVIPVYYNVDKYSLENQLETCAGGFDQLQQTGYASSQRRAIEEIAGMPGLDLNKFTPRSNAGTNQFVFIN